MSANYDGSAVGVPYVVAGKLTIEWTDSASGVPRAIIEQGLRVKLADGSVRDLNEALPTLNVPLDFAAHGNDPVPIVDINTGNATGQYTTLNATFAQVLAIIRTAQIASGQ
jgi:hypothetical protein